MYFWTFHSIFMSIVWMFYTNAFTRAFIVRLPEFDYPTFQSCFGLCMTFCCYGDENAVFATVVMINWITHSQKNQWINTSLHVYCLLTDCISELILVIGLPSCASLWPGATLLPPSYRNQGSHLEPWATTLLTTIQTGKLLVYMLKTGTFECCSDMY